MTKPPVEPHQRQHRTTSTAPLAVPPGTLLIGTYEILEHLNTGGMGEVYRGINIHNEEVVAIKIVLPALAHDEKILSLFQKESTVLRRIAHDAIVRYEVFTRDPALDRPCLIMEYAAGPSLGDRMEHGPLGLQEVLILLQRLTAGLDVAHRNGVVHRDLSPDNVILCGNDVAQAKIIDFGIAKASTPGGRTLIGGQFAGKPGYVAPEQLGLYEGHVTGQADIYSMGLLAAAAALGYPLDMGDSPAAAVMARIKVPDLSGIDPELVPLLEWMLQPDPANRPASMAEINAWIVAHFSDLLSSIAPKDHTFPPGTIPPRSAMPITGAPVSGAAISAPPQQIPGPNRAPYQPTVLADRPPASVLSSEKSVTPVARQTTLPPAVPAEPSTGMTAPLSVTAPPDQSASPFGPGPESVANLPPSGRRPSENNKTQAKSGALPLLPIAAGLGLVVAIGGVWMSGLLGSDPAPQIAPAPPSIAEAGPSADIAPAPPEPAPARIEPPAPPPAPDVQTLQAWLDARILAGMPEPCAWLPRGSAVTGASAYAGNATAFDPFETAFGTEFGQNLPLVVHPLVPAQCPAFEQLAKLEQIAPPSGRLAVAVPPQLTPSTDAVLQVQLTGQAQGNLTLLVIDPAGRVQNITDLIAEGQVELTGQRITPPADEVARGTGAPVFTLLALDTVQPLPVMGALPGNAILPASNAQEFWRFVARDLQALPTPPDYAHAVVIWAD